MIKRSAGVVLMSLLMISHAHAQRGGAAGWAAGAERSGDAGAGVLGPGRGSEWAQREVSLPDILRDLRERYGGQHLDAQRAGSVYRISWLTDDGRRLMIEVDAATGRPLSVRG
jgi:hypothetical protein